MRRRESDGESVMTEGRKTHVKMYRRRSLQNKALTATVLCLIHIQQSVNIICHLLTLCCMCMCYVVE